MNSWLVFILHIDFVCAMRLWNFVIITLLNIKQIHSVIIREEHLFYFTDTCVVHLTNRHRTAYCKGDQSITDRSWQMSINRDKKDVLKEKVYSKSVKSLDELRERVSQAAKDHHQLRSIKSRGYARLISRSFLRRCRACINADGK